MTETFRSFEELSEQYHPLENKNPPMVSAEKLSQKPLDIQEKVVVYQLWY